MWIFMANKKKEREKQQKRLIFSLYNFVHYKTFIEFTLSVSRTKVYSFQIWDIFVDLAVSELSELALVMRKCLPFFIIDTNSPHW